MHSSVSKAGQLIPHCINARTVSSKAETSERTIQNRKAEFVMYLPKGYTISFHYL